MHRSPSPTVNSSERRVAQAFGCPKRALFATGRHVVSDSLCRTPAALPASTYCCGGKCKHAQRRLPRQNHRSRRSHHLSAAGSPINAVYKPLFISKSTYGTLRLSFSTGRSLAALSLLLVTSEGKTAAAAEAPQQARAGGGGGGGERGRAEQSRASSRSSLLPKKMSSVNEELCPVWAPLVGFTGVLFALVFASEYCCKYAQ